MNISITNLFIIFIIYSFLGYIAEVIYVSYHQKKLVNRGFLYGPICPIYGCGGVLIILFLREYFDDPMVIFVFSMILASLIEFITSWILEKIFMHRWWDYSDKKFNIEGRVCLKNSLLFGVAALVMVYLINPVLFKIIRSANGFVLKIIALILFIVFIVDFIYSIVGSIYLRKGIVIAKNVKKVRFKNIPGHLDKVIKEQFSGFKHYPSHFLKGFPELKKVNNEAFDLMNKIKVKDQIKQKEIKNINRKKRKH